jgi:predicted nucleotidyltransferase
MASPKSLVSREVAEAVHRIAALHGVHSVRVFGSAARREQRPDSDIDLLVDMEPRSRLLDLFAFAQDLEEVLAPAPETQWQEVQEMLRDAGGLGS